MYSLAVKLNAQRPIWQIVLSSNTLAESLVYDFWYVCMGSIIHLAMFLRWSHPRFFLFVFLTKKKVFYSNAVHFKIYLSSVTNKYAALASKGLFCHVICRPHALTWKQMSTRLAGDFPERRGNGSMLTMTTCCFNKLASEKTAIILQTSF